MKKSPVSLLLTSGLLAFPFALQALPQYLGGFKVSYPKASSFGCELCHASASGGGPRNAYGQSFERGLTGSIAGALRKIEPQDSDRDGRTNLTEITASTDTVAIHPGLSSSVPPKLLFYDNFTNATATVLPNWTKVSGTWIGNGKSLTSSKRTVGLANPTTPESLNRFVNGSIVVRIQLNPTAGTSPNAYIVFNQQTQNKYRYVRIESGRIAIGQVGSIDGVGPGVKKMVSRSVGTRSHKVKVTLTPAGLVTVFLDNARAAAASFKFPKAVAGKVGLLTSKAQTNFDDFTVSK